jgi:hypothetical protein
MSQPPRRFPQPWSVEETSCFIVTDSAGQKLAYVYFEDEPGGRVAAKLIKFTVVAKVLSLINSRRFCVKARVSDRG